MAPRNSALRRVLRQVRAAWLKPLSDALAVDHEATIREIQHVRLALANLQADRARAASTLREAEFRGFSQFGEDGAIQWLLAHVPMVDQSFVEFGVEDYRESNTRFLLERGGWRGLILDPGTDHIRFLRESGLAARAAIDAQQAFVTVENINKLLNGQPYDLGLLSVDIDGMDYWVLAAIRDIRPRVVVCEYNSLFGPVAPVSVPYQPQFDRRTAHHSMLYFGASISALEHWGRTNGYRLVGSTIQGVNAFLVRHDVAGDLPDLSGHEAWVKTSVRQARDADGSLTYLADFEAQQRLIGDLPLVDVVTGRSMRVGDLP